LVLYVPGGHEPVQVDRPLWSLYLPGPHSKQLIICDDDDMPTAVEYVPKGHFAHVVFVA
jgi:hypothetical protein